jgi:thiamine-monophosphate kinase
MASGEDELIAKFFKPIATHPGALSLQDDAAFLSPPHGHDLVVTTDALVGGVHFFADDPADAVARKALRVNLSDLAAKGATPVAFLLTLAIPAKTGEDWLAAFSEGLRADAQAFACALLGGDTVHTPGPIAISVFAIGNVPSGKMVRRLGAQAGDRVIVTGTIGDAALGLALRRAQEAPAWKLDSTHRTRLLGRYLFPQPRVAAIQALREHASAAMDISDGLVGDLAKLCGASGVSARIDVSRVPLSDSARAVLACDGGALQTILTGGDDYEIVCTMKAAEVERFRAPLKLAGIAVTDIGEIVPGGEAPQFVDAAGHPLSFARSSYSHI